MLLLDKLIIMEGISIIHDRTNNRRYVQIDLDMFDSDHIQDMLDGLVAYSRRNEESYPLDEVLKELVIEGKLDE